MNNGKSPIARFLADPNDEQFRTFGHCAFLQAQQHCQSLDAHRKAYARNRRTAALLHQAVVAAASRNRALRTEPRSRPFEGRPTIIIETAHHAWVERESDAGLPEQALHGFKVLATSGAEGVENRRRVFRRFDATGFFAVQSPQRDTRDATAAIPAEEMFPPFQEGLHHFTVLGP